MTSHIPYLKPPWMQRKIANRLVPLFQPSLISNISKLTVRGRKSGRAHTVPIAVLEFEGERYLVSYRGESDWAKNIRASKTAILHTYAGSEEIVMDEVPEGQRAPLMAT